MIILAIDTCLGAVSVALGWTDGDGADRIAHRREERATGHAERLFPMIVEVLAQAGLEMADVARVAVTVGPGTFTGVRIAIAAARGFRLASGCEVVGATSLEVMALAADRQLASERGGRDLVVAVDARRGQIYIQRFGMLQHDRLATPELLSIADAVAALPRVPTLVVGSGAQSLVASATADGMDMAGRLDRLEPDAMDLLGIAPTLQPRDAVQPLYIRAPDAKPPAARTPLRA